MGIFSVPTLSVRNTRIYVSPSSHNQNQLTLYTTEVNTLFDEGYLILPVPYPHTIRFHDCRSTLHFLDSLEDVFSYRGRHIPKARSRETESQLFEDITIIHSLDEFCQLNQRDHILPTSVVSHLSTIYSEHYWGFLLCSLRCGSFVYEPLCYSHRMIDDNLFLPCLLYQPSSCNDTRILDESNKFDDRYFMNGCHYSENMKYSIVKAYPESIDTIPWTILPSNYTQYLPSLLNENRKGLHWNADARYQIEESYFI